MMRFWMVLLFANMAHAAVEPVLIKTLTEVTGGGLSVTGSTVVVTSTYEIIQSTVSVVSGSGFSVFDSTGQMTQCAINPAVSTATYSFEIVTNDSDEFPVAGKDGLSGKVSLYFLRFILGSHKMQISNASSNGIYKARCVILK